MYCTTCGIDAERPWCPYCGDDMVEIDEAEMFDLKVEEVARQDRKSRRARRRVRDLD